MIAPDMATMLAYVFTDAADRVASVAGDAVEIGAALVQRDHRRQRHLDLRHADAVRHRRGQERDANRRRRRSARRRVPSRARQASAQSRPSGGARRRRRAQVHHREGRRRGDPQGGQAHRALDRQFAARQDRLRRRGRQLGPRGDGGRQGGREGRARQARHLSSARSASPTKACAIPSTTKRRHPPT